MGRILSYSELTLSVSGDVLFIGDISTNASNPEIKYITTDNLFKRTTIWAADSNGLSLKDDGGNLGIFIKDGGNVGINENDPNELVEISGTSSGLSTEVFAIRLHNTRGATGANAGDAEIQLFEGGDIDSTVLHIAVANGSGALTKLLTIDGENGRIGINQSSPTEGVHIQDKNVKISNDTGNCILYISSNESSGTGASWVVFDNGGDSKWTLLNNAVNQLRIYDYVRAGFCLTIGSNGDMRLMEDGGNVVIGADNASARLHVSRSDSGSGLLIENTGVTSSIIQIKNSAGNSSYITRGPSNLILGSSSTAGATTLNIAATTGNTHIGGTDTNFKLQITSADYQISRLNSSAAAGGAIGFLSTQTNPTNLVLTFSRTVTSTPNVGWMIGNFYSSASYFGIHYKNATLNDTNAKFDTSVLTNNLFYIDTNGNQYLGKSINTHNLTNSGHNTGRFVQVFSLPFYCQSSSGGRLSPLFSAPYDITTNINDANSIGKYEFSNKAPCDGKVLRVDLSVTANEDLNFDLYIYSGATIPAATLTSANCAYKLTLNTGGTDADFSIGYDDFTEKTRLDFSQNDFLMMAATASTGEFNANVTVTVEFKIPETF